MSKKDKKQKKEVKKYTVADLAEPLGLSISDTKETFKDLIGFLENLEIGDKVSIPGLGIFTKVVKKPRKARNPRTGETFTTKAKVTLKFRLANTLRDL